MTKTEIAAELIDCVERLGAQKVAKFCDEGFKGSYAVLKAISMSAGEAYAAELARTLHVSTARITVALNSLEQKELICRSQLPAGRHTIVSLTPSGEAFLMEQEAELIGQLVLMMRNLTDDEAEQFLNLVRKL